MSKKRCCLVDLGMGAVARTQSEKNRALLLAIQGENPEAAFAILNAMSPEERKAITPNFFLRQVLPLLAQIKEVDRVTLQFLFPTLSDLFTSQLASHAAHRFFPKMANVIFKGLNQISKLGFVCKLAMVAYFRHDLSKKSDFEQIAQVQMLELQLAGMGYEMMPKMSNEKRDMVRIIERLNAYNGAVSDFDAKIGEVAKKQKHLPALPTVILGIIADYLRPDWYASNQEKTAAVPMAITFSASAKRRRADEEGEDQDPDQRPSKQAKLG